MSLQGKVKFYNVHRTFGMITSENDTGPDIYFNQCHLPKHSVPFTGDLVGYELGPSPLDGKLRAIKVWRR
jgi:cold shock CspA family protein